MAFLRLPEDDTLATTLGNLGASLGNALNPRNQLEAQALVDQIQAQRFNLQRQQQLDAANANAAIVYSRANPLGLSDADLAATVAQIRNGSYDPSRWAEGVTSIGKYRANQTASDAVNSDPDVQGYTPAEQSSVKALVLGGTSLADAKSQVANERLTAGKTSAALGAADAASTAASQLGAPAELGPLARSAAFGDPKTAEALAATARVFGAGNLGAGSAANMFTDPNLSAATNDLFNNQQLAGMTRPQGQGPTVALTPQTKAVDTGAAIGAAQAAPRAPGQVVAPTTIDLTTGAVTPAAPPAGAPAAPGQVAAQNIERTRQVPEVAATQRAQGSARDLVVARPGLGGSGNGDLRRKIHAQIRQGRRVPDQGSADAADVLRLSRRSLGPLANLEPDRERVRDGEASHRPHERRAVAGYRASHGVQTGDGRVQDLAAFERSKPVAESRQRYKVQRRNRSCRRNQIRRLIHAVTDFPA